MVKSLGGRLETERMLANRTGGTRGNTLYINTNDMKRWGDIWADQLQTKVTICYQQKASIIFTNVLFTTLESQP
jgi:hypothetical protein